MLTTSSVSHTPILLDLDNFNRVAANRLETILEYEVTLLLVNENMGTGSVSDRDLLILVWNPPQRVVSIDARLVVWHLNLQSLKFVSGFIIIVATSD